MSRIRDLERESPDSGIADVCIIGAGAAGIALAVELLRLGKRVTLLEGGGLELEANSQNLYQSEVVGQRHLGIHTGRFRVKGGTTTRWGGQILELDDADFERRSHVEGSGWPFPKSVLAPFYARALAVEGLQKVLRDDGAVWRDLGEPRPAFTGLPDYLSRWCPEPNFARLHSRILQSHPALDVWLHASAVSLQMDGSRVREVVCRTLTGRSAVFRATRYVFCLGGIESIRFFLQPQPGTLPWNRSGLLGKYFQDHIDACGAEVKPLSRKSFHNVFDNIFLAGLKYQLKLRLAEDKQHAFKTLNVGGNMIFLSEDQEGMDQIKASARHVLKGRWAQVDVRSLTKAARYLPTVVNQAYRYKAQHRLYNPPSARVMLRIWCEQEPLSGSTVTLADERDALGLFRTRLDWRISDRELDTMRRYIEIAATSLQGVARLIPDPDLIRGDRAFLTRCNDCYHHMGGMRMSDSESSGVVDTNLRLYGTDNAYVCSAAVFPSSGYSNPTHTLVALATRLAEHVSGLPA